MHGSSLMNPHHDPSGGGAAGFQVYVFPTVESDTSNRYDSTNGTVTLTDAGLYLIQGVMRIDDKSPVGTQFGVGVYTADEANDGPYFLWHAVQDTINDFDRTSFPYTRLARFSANDKLSMRVYVDRNVGSGCKMDYMSMNIVRLSA